MCLGPQKRPKEASGEGLTGLTAPHSEGRLATAASRTAPGQGNATKMQEDGKMELKEEDAWDELGFSFPSWKKWMILTVIFLVQTSMNFNTSLYSNGLGGISRQFNVSEQAARAGAAIFLVAYGFGCELWAPWSEEFGRKPVLQLSLGLVNIWCLPVALAPNFASLLVGRALGGFSSAGGSVTLGMIADVFEPDEQQYAVAYIVFSSVGGSILGPIIGGFVEAYLDWTWTIWIQLIFGGFCQILHFLLVPEMRTTILLDRIAKKRRESGQSPNVYGPNELEPFFQRFTFRELIWTWVRPFRMFMTEPIVLTLSLLSGFSDALIFMQIQSFALVYRQWAIWLNKKECQLKPGSEHAQYESRLWWLLYTAPCLPIGLIIFAWTSGGPPIHWVGTMVGSTIIGIANYSIYMATINFSVHDLRLRAVCRFSNWGKRLVSGLFGRRVDGASNAVLHQHRWGPAPGDCKHNPILYLARPRVC
ncbi:major facilitator superfamily domain-containing protein [Lasiosphaeria hispida]|uniref:Major facilitator superfamily domain-containing protein n=1 Tax=Lasiosphaeria hispida TaxID=260671 RepID=A0AAJ0HJJ6_9PEZI|nr:major facilitator superfamily domain-containing protein [Lasiosphaeria hispida]